MASVNYNALVIKQQQKKEWRYSVASVQLIEITLSDRLGNKLITNACYLT